MMLAQVTLKTAAVKVQKHILTQDFHLKLFYKAVNLS